MKNETLHENVLISATKLSLGSWFNPIELHDEIQQDSLFSPVITLHKCYNHPIILPGSAIVWD